MNKFIEIPANKRSISKRKLILGAGINDASYMTRLNGVRCLYYQSWKNMLRRCYSDKEQDIHPTYIGCTVVDEWLLFSNFKGWMEKQEWRGMHLDKDILIKGNKAYGPEGCIFIPQSLNKLLNDRAADRGECPVGVHFYKRDGNYQAYCNVDGKRKHLGYFDTAEEASKTYNKFKANHIREIAKEYITEIRLYNGLIAHANLIDN